MSALYRSIPRLLVILALTASALVTAQASAGAALPGPTMVYPTAGQKISYGDSFYFRVNPVAGATGYLYGFFQNGVAVWENYAQERKLSGSEYAIVANGPAHNAIQPGNLQIWVRAYVNNNWTEATITNIALDPFYCITGPGGSCNGVGPVTRPSAMTWGGYLNWLDDLARGVQDGSTLLTCAAGAQGFDLGRSCLQLVFDKFAANPYLTASVDALLCFGGAAGAVPAAVVGCLGTGALGIRALIWAVHEAAKHDPNIARFLKSPMAF